MMRQMKLIYTFLLAAALSMLTACSGDDAANGGETPTQNDGKIKVHLRVSAAGSETMRAWQDNENATDAEMMNVWTVVAVHDEGTNANKVAAIYACKPSQTADPSSREIDDVAYLPEGKYRFYSFANMSPQKVMSLLEIDGTGLATPYDDPDSDTGGDNTSGNNQNAIGSYTEYTDDVYYKLAFTDGEQVTVDAANAVATLVNGNNFNISATNNGFEATGIPMSNVQTLTITNNSTLDLIVVRMMAKIELQIKNTTTEDIKVNSVTLSNVTKNSADNSDVANLKLLPNLSGHNTMDVLTHGDIQPNLGTVAQADLNVPITDGTIAPAATKKVTFYVNECGTPNNPEHLFYLTLDIDNAGTSEYRYALIDQETSSDADHGKWNYIARNDYRIIPINLEDLKFEIIPYDFPAIGVYPVSVKELDATNHLYEFTFHDYGHFHLLPVVTRGGSPVAFTNTTPSGGEYLWRLVNGDWTNSWFTAATSGATAWMTDTEITSNGFYRDQTATADGDEVGGKPYWYVNDGTAGPQWDPAGGTNYRPFVFGYIADPGASMSEDKKIYHEMKIEVYNGTEVYRQMVYRFYMTLSADQMLYSRMFGAPRVRHTHGY